MPDTIENKEMKAKRAFRGRMAQAMLAGSESVNLRTALSLQIAGVMKSGREQETAPEIAAAIRSSSSPKAPLLIVPTPQGNVRNVVATTDLLGSPDPVTRIAALDAILAAGTATPPALLPSTLRTIESEKAGLSATERWQKSAAAVLDAIDSDWLYQLALLRQCVNSGIDDAVASHASEVLRPKTMAVATLARDLLADVPAGQPSARCSEIVRTAKSAIEVMERYVDAVGIMPLGGDLSIVAVFREWSKTDGRETPRFSVLLDWATSRSSPFAPYHVCRLAAGWPEIVEAKEWPAFWETTIGVLRWWSEGRVGSPERQRWALRASLLAHFARHDELVAPMPVQSESMCSLAMWQAEQVASVFHEEAALGWAVDQLAEPQAQQTGWVWSLARPMATRSLARYASLHSRLLWASALLSDIDRNIDRLHVAEASESQHKALAEIVVAAFVTGFPPKSETGSVFDFGRLPNQVLATLVRVGSAESKGMLQGVSELASATMSPEDLFRSIGSRAEGGGPNPQAQFLAYRARMLAYLGELPDEAVWEVASDPKWRKDVLVCGGADLVEPVLDALCELLTHNPGRWKARFPHMLAETLEQDCKDESERMVIFGLLVLSCVVTETTSALERVLKGPSAEHLPSLVSTWRLQLTNCIPMCPDWVKGRLRATLATLRTQ